MADVYRDVAPLSLIESHYAQCAAGDVPYEYGDPDMDRLQRAHLPDEEADPEWHQYLRDDRDVEGASGVPGPLQSARVSERRRDEEARQAQHPEELDPNLHDRRLVHPEDRQQLPGEEQKENAD